MNRREAEELGLRIEKPSAGFYRILRGVHLSYAAQMKLVEPYSPQVELGTRPTVNFSLTRVVESTEGGCYAFISEGTLTSVTAGAP
jgi:hypothetical protein